MSTFATSDQDSLCESESESNAPASSPPVIAEVAEQTTFIRPSQGWQALDLPELWRYRELFLIFAARDIKVRYKQTFFGAAWALIQPLAFTILGTVVFGKVAGASTDGVTPTFLFYLCSQVPWMLFNTGLQTSSNSLVGAQNMLKKIYFPRLVLPTSAAMVSLVDAGVQLLLILLVMLTLPLVPGVPTFVPPSQALLLPVAVLWAFLAALSVGLPLAALNVEFRDVRYVIPFVTQFLIFAAPVFWPASSITEAWRPVYGLLPAAGPIELFRWCLLGTPAHPGLWAVSAMSTLSCLVLGLLLFRRLEDRFADVV